MVQRYGLDVANLRNELSYNQNAAFDACVLKDQMKAIRLVNYFINHGVDPAQEDGLK